MRATSGTGRSRPRGFTLLELLVVIAIIALISVAVPVALPHLVPRQRLRSDSESLAAGLREARGRATALERRVVVNFDETDRSLSLEHARVWRASRDVSVRMRTPGSGADGKLQFFADGSSSGAAFLLTLEGRQVTVEVSPMTGRVRVESP